MTVERPLRLRGIDAERAYSPKEIKALKETAERDEDAPPVIRKIHKERRSGRSAARPVRGRRSRAKRCVVEYEPDPDLRDTEQVPLLEAGGIEAFIEREVLPHAADAWFDDDERQDRLRDQLQSLFLQAAAVALARRDPGGHSGAWSGRPRGCWTKSCGRRFERVMPYGSGAVPDGDGQITGPECRALGVPRGR